MATKKETKKEVKPEPAKESAPAPVNGTEVIKQMFFNMIKPK